MALSIEPPYGIFPAAGGTVNFDVVSTSQSRLAYKVKCSNNERYRVTPVYGFVEKKSKSDLAIIRLAGSPTRDKFVIEWAEVLDSESDPQAPFKAGLHSGEVVLHVKAD